MRVTVNGEAREVSEGITVAALLREVADADSSPPGRVAVEVNLEVVKRADHDTRVLQPGDQVEIVAFVGGG